MAWRNRNPDNMSEGKGAVTGLPNLILRAEGLAVLIAVAWAYSLTDAGWTLVAVLILAPDLTALGYLAGPRIGAAAYNLGHSYLGPMALLALGYSGAMPMLTAMGLIWAAHIGADRLMGYGLKYSGDFRATHLSAPSKKAIRAASPTSR